MIWVDCVGNIYLNISLINRRKEFVLSPLQRDNEKYFRGHIETNLAKKIKIL